MNAVGYFVEGARRNGGKRAIGDQNRGFLEFCQRQGYEVAATFLDTEGQDLEALRSWADLVRGRRPTGR